MVLFASDEFDSSNYLSFYESIFRSGMSETVYQFEAKDSQGTSVNLDTFRGKVILVVNVASK